MRSDFSSALFKPLTAQGFWNMMDMFTDDDMREIKDRVRGSSSPLDAIIRNCSLTV